NGQWRVMVLLGLGALAAAATIGLLWGDRLRDRIAGTHPDGEARSLDSAAPPGPIEAKITAAPGPVEFI
ncbi:MAG: hypothetical protein ABJD68_18645, partial [Nakamurella sp.]